MRTHLALCELLAERLQVGSNWLLRTATELSRSCNIYAAHAVALASEHHVVSLGKCTASRSIRVTVTREVSAQAHVPHAESEAASHGQKRHCRWMPGVAYFRLIRIPGLERQHRQNAEIHAKIFAAAAAACVLPLEHMGAAGMYARRP